MKYAEQYKAIKATYPDALVVVRLGDYMEAYNDDAKVLVEVLDTILVSRKVGADRWPMAAVPWYRSESAIAKLIEAGHRVALMEPVSAEPVDGVIPRVARILPTKTINIDGDGNADWIKRRSRTSELRIHDEIAKGTK